MPSLLARLDTINIDALPQGKLYQANVHQCRYTYNCDLSTFNINQSKQ